MNFTHTAHMSPQGFHFNAMATYTPNEEFDTEWHGEFERSEFLQVVHVYCNTSGSSAKI